MLRQPHDLFYEKNTSDPGLSTQWVCQELHQQNKNLNRYLLILLRGLDRNRKLFISLSF